MFENLTILITGGTGFVGRNLINELLKTKVEKVIIFDRTLKYNWNDERVEYMEGNLLTDLDKFRSLNFDLCFHQAANVDTTCEDEELMVNTNFHSFVKLLEICQTKSAPLIYASSAATYGESPAPNRVGFGENPLNIYGKSKLMMDQFIRENNFTIPVFGLRYFNVYGSGEQHKGKMMSMVSQMENKIKQNQNVQLFEFGEQIRDFVNVKDIAMYNILCGNLAINFYKNKNLKYILNCGSGMAISFNHIFKVLKIQNPNSTSQIIYIKNPYSFYQNHTEADISETVKLLNFTPQYFIFESPLS